MQSLRRAKIAGESGANKVERYPTNEARQANPASAQRAARISLLLCPRGAQRGKAKFIFHSWGGKSAARSASLPDFLALFHSSGLAVESVG